MDAVFFLFVTLCGLNALSLTFCMTLNFLASQFAFLKGHRHLAASILLVIYFLFGILFCTEQGLKILVIWEYYAIGLGPLCIVVLEIIAVFYWNKETLKPVDFENPKLIKFVDLYYRYVLLALVVIALVVSFISDCMNPLNAKGFEQGLAWLLFLIPLMLFGMTVILKKKLLLYCVKDQVVEGHMLDLDADKIDSEVGLKSRVNALGIEVSDNTSKKAVEVPVNVEMISPEDKRSVDMYFSDYSN